MYIRTFSSSLYLWLLGALLVLFWYSFSLHLCLCYSLVYKRRMHWRWAFHGWKRSQFSCTRGGYVTLRHNELRDLFEELLRKTSTNISIEPELQLLSGEVFRAASAVVSDGTRLDIKASGSWASRHDVDFFDVRVFNPLGSSYQHQSVDQTYSNHKWRKMLAYGDRVSQVEHGTLTPLVFTCMRGAGSSGTHFIKRLVSKISDRRDMSYSQAVRWLRCRVSFALLRSAIICLRGSRGKKQCASIRPALAATQARINELG